MKQIELGNLRNHDPEHIKTIVKRDWVMKIADYIYEHFDDVLECYTDVDPLTDMMNYRARIRFLTKDYKFMR